MNRLEKQYRRFKKEADAGWFRPPAHTALMQLMKATKEILKAQGVIDAQTSHVH